MKQKAAQKFIYKIHTKQLKRNNWKLDLPLETAMQDYSDLIVSINDSQMLRWIDELNGVEGYEEQIDYIKRQIKYWKRKPKNNESRKQIESYYRKLYNLQFQKDYVCIVMDSVKDYDRANQGFEINGIRFKRLLGTNGGVKTSTIVYVNEELWPRLRERIDNGRKMTKELVPAKFEVHEFEAERSVKVRDRRDIPEYLLQSLIQEPVVGVLLNLNQVRHLQYFPLF